MRTSTLKTGNGSGYSDTLKPMRLFGSSGYSHDDDNGFVFTPGWSGKKERQSRTSIKQETFEKHAAIVAEYATLTHIPLEKDKLAFLADRYDLAPYSVGIILKKGKNVRRIVPADVRKAA